MRGKEPSLLNKPTKLIHFSYFFLPIFRMGKTQSKRSVDITTEISKDGLATEENTGKLGKIEDAEPQLKPQLNGDSNHKDADAPVSELFMLITLGNQFGPVTR